MQSNSTNANSWRLLAIDPSIVACGWAVLEGEEAKICGIGVYNPPKDLGAAARAVEVAREMLNVAHYFRPEVAVIEQPDNWQLGRGLASKDAGDIQKLYQCAGAIESLLIVVAPSISQMYGVLPKQWKGSTPKEIMLRRAHAFIQMTGQKLKVIGEMDHNMAEALLLAKMAVAHATFDADGENGILRPPFVPLHLIDRSPYELAE